ncbi:MAG: hypothetical protein KF770_32230 [Anaerolineae bacterium]|nr:hypothetical protein [Anaerolineae bacterium]
MSRPMRLALAGFMGLLLLACLAGLIYLLSTYPILARPSPVGTPVAWSGLPRPVVIHPQWTSFTAPQSVNDAVLHEGLLWAATDGGVVVWAWATGEVTRFTTEHGLAENIVTSTAVGRDGALWFGTESGGLSRYDGRSWQTFTTADGLPANHITDLAVTADGMVWAATDAGVGQYDGRRWYSHTRARSFFQLPGEQMRALAVAPDGVTVWAGTDNGVARWDGRRWQEITHVGSLNINDIQDIAITPDGMVWAATPGGLKRYDGKRWQIYTSGDGLVNDAVSRVTAVPDNTVWLAYADPAAGLTLFDTTGPTPVATTAGVVLPALRVTAVWPNGLLLTIPGGLFYADNGGDDRLFTAPADLPDQQVTGLAAANGAVWVSSAAGVSRFEGATWRTYTTTHGLVSTATSTTLSAGVSALTLDANGQPVVAFTAASQGIARYNAALDGWQPVVCPAPGPPSVYVRAGLQTADGALWFATDRGLARYAEDNWRVFTTLDGLPSDNVQTITLRGETLWAGTDKGLAFFQDGEWRTALLDNVRALSSGPEGTLWFFNADGLFAFAPDGRALTPIPLPPVQQVYDQLVTAHGFWLAADAGVFFWPVDRAEWQTFPAVDGQPMGEVTALAQTADGRIYAGSSQGLWQLAPEEVWLLRPLPGQERSPITRLVVDADASLLVGTFDGRVYRVRAGEIVIEKPMPTGSERAPVSAILPVAETLWVAHFGGGVFWGAGNIGERNWQRVATDEGLQAAVNSLAVGVGDDAWLGTDKGLLLLTSSEVTICRIEQGGEPPTWAGVLVDRQGQVWGVNGPAFWRLDGGNRMRSGTLVKAVTAVAPDGAVWVVTESGLVRHLAGRRQTVSTPASFAQITALAPADNGALAVGTTAGLYWYDGRAWRHFTAAVGLAANHVTQVAVAADGSVWVGTAGGVSWLRP